MLVKTCSLVPPFQNNPNEPIDPLGRDIYENIHDQTAYNSPAIVPNDHWSILGASMQKYLAGRCGRRADPGYERLLGRTGIRKKVES